MSFASLAASLASIDRHLAILAIDARGHGETPKDDKMLSIDTLVTDMVDVLSSILPKQGVDIVLIGHSFGGALAAHVSLHIPAPHRLHALVLMESVEGTALDGLAHMPAFLAARPKTFVSVDDAVAWTVKKTGTPKTTAAARISVPSQLRQRENGVWEWRASLEASAEHWVGWFMGMTVAFLSAPCTRKLVILAADLESVDGGADRLDTALTVAHMQGQFQLALIPGTGHAVHEDAPQSVARRILDIVR